MIDHKKAVVYWKEFEFPQYKEREISIEINRDFIIAVINIKEGRKDLSLLSGNRGLIEKRRSKKQYSLP